MGYSFLSFDPTEIEAFPFVMISILIWLSSRTVDCFMIYTTLIPRNSVLSLRPWSDIVGFIGIGLLVVETIYNISSYILSLLIYIPGLT